MRFVAKSGYRLIDDSLLDMAIIISVVLQSLPTQVKSKSFVLRRELSLVNDKRRWRGKGGWVLETGWIMS